MENVSNQHSISMKGFQSNKQLAYFGVDNDDWEIKLIKISFITQA